MNTGAAAPVKRESAAGALRREGVMTLIRQDRRGFARRHACRRGRAQSDVDRRSAGLRRDRGVNWPGAFVSHRATNH